MVYLLNLLLFPLFVFLQKLSIDMNKTNEKYISEAKLSEKPQKKLHLVLTEGCVTNSKMADNAVSVNKLSGDLQERLNVPEQLDQKYTNITNELYNMIASIQVGGIALSNKFGNREDIGISQKTLTIVLGRILNELGTITGKDYMGFTLTVEPAVTFAEAPVTISITADCSEAISDYDLIQIYVDNVLVAESHDLTTFTTTQTINQTSEVKAVGIIMGKTVTKIVTAIKELPFFMGSGQNYTDVMNLECHKPLIGTLEGDYDVTVKHDGEKVFIVIPISKKEEFRRAKLDMNGFEIPISVSETSDLIICESLNTYRAGTYNVDIDINS